jgi:hypothetical protein
MNFRSLLLPLTCLLAANGAVTEEPDPCMSFRWDVTHERALMKETPRAVEAAAEATADMPELKVGELHEVKLSRQGDVLFPAVPGMRTPNDGAFAGLVRFRVPKSGLYRVSISTPHWIDIVNAGQLIKARDFQGQRGCERPHKIVEFELPADRELMLQLSGSGKSRVLLAITAAG